MDDKFTEALTFEEVALLDANGFEVDDAELRGRRVAVRFRDPDGRAADLIRRHHGMGVDVNSAAFERGLARAKQLVFATRDRRR